MSELRPGEHEFRGRPTLPELLYAEEAQISLVYPEESRVSVLDFLVVIARNLRLIAATTVVVGLIGLYFALSPEVPVYEASATVVREGQSGGGSDFPSFGGLFSFGSQTTGLSPVSYPDILRSREVRLGVVRDTFYFSTLNQRMTLVDYFSPVASTDGAVPREEKTNSSPVYNYTYPTSREEYAMWEVEQAIGTTIDKQSGLMRISAKADDPQLAADLPLSFVEHLQKRVREIHSQKAQQNLTFIRGRFEEADRQLRAAEAELANFLDRNRNIETAQLQIMNERLERIVQFKAQLYSNLQTQLVQAEMELQKSLPVITVIEYPVAPGGPVESDPNLIVLLSLFLGALLGVGVAFVRWFFEKQGDDEQNREKLGELRSALPSANLIRRLRPWAKNGKPTKTGVEAS